MKTRRVSKYIVKVFDLELCQQENNWDEILENFTEELLQWQIKQKDTNTLSYKVRGYYQHTSASQSHLIKNDGLKMGLWKTKDVPALPYHSVSVKK